MKIRVGFVSNSSSASFHCEICNVLYYQDRSPILIGGVCQNCEKERRFCNACYNIGPVEDCFKTDDRYVKIVDVSRLEDQVKKIPRDDYNGDMELHTDYTCRSCLDKEENNDLFEAFLKRLDRDSWITRISNPNHEFTPLDIKVSTFLINRGIK